MVFAETCARCHSSKLPASVAGLDPGGCAGPGYLDCWNKYWASTKTDEFKKQMREIVLKDDFLEGNYLSTEARVPVTLLETNACSPLATNAIAGNIWDNYSSQSYKSLPSVGTITVHNPFTGEPRQYTMPAGGRGYTRPASLISLWSTAPFLLNNTVGLFNGDPSVKGRMAAFEDGIEKMLWPEKRDKDPVLGDKVPGLDRPDDRVELSPGAGRLPAGLRAEAARRWSEQLAPAILGETGHRDRADPQGHAGQPADEPQPRCPTTRPRGSRLAHDKKLLELLIEDQARPQGPAGGTPPTSRRGRSSPTWSSRCSSSASARTSWSTAVTTSAPTASRRSRASSDADKRALIEFLKTF